MTNEYRDIIQQDQTSDLRSALTVAAQRPADAEAQLQKLSGRTGVPLDALRLKQPEVELHDKLESFDYERVIKDSPKLSAWMAKPDNAALAQDDWQTLSAMERGITHIKDYAGALGGGVVGDAIGRTLSGASTLLDVGARAIDRPVRAALALLRWLHPVACCLEALARALERLERVERRWLIPEGVSYPVAKGGTNGPVDGTRPHIQ